MDLMKNNIRAFIALELDTRIQAELKRIQNKLKHLTGEIFWASPDNFHLSVRFLGNISQGDIKTIEKINQKIAKRVKAFPLALSVLGVFPYISDPQVLWAGINSGYSQVTQINTLLSKDLSTLNIKSGDRHFHPHITLARIKSLKNKSELSKLIDTIKPSAGSEDISNLILYKSELSKQGAIYTKLSEVELGKT